MTTGRDNLQLINQHIYQAQTDQEQAGQHLAALHQQLNDLRLKTSEGYRELAKFRLDDLQARQVITRLDETDQAVLGLVEKLKQARADLDGQLQASVARQRQLEEQRKELEGRRDGAGEAMQRVMTQIERVGPTTATTGPRRRSRGQTCR